MARRRHGRMLGALVFGFATLLLLPTSPALGAEDPASESRFVELVDSERQSRGLAPLAVAPDLVSVARRHAERMAAEGRLSHNPNLGSEVENWQTVGENVGRGANVDDTHRAFMASSSHRDNILDGRFTEIGAGVAAVNGEIWIVEVFRQPAAAAAPPPQPQPAPAAAPSPAPAESEPAPPRPVRAARTAPAPSAAPVPTAAAPAATIPPTTAPPAPVLRPPVESLPAGPPPTVVLSTLPVREVSRGLPPRPPAIPLPVKLAATLLVSVLAAEVLTFRRLGLIPAPARVLP